MTISVFVSKRGQARTRGWGVDEMHILATAQRCVAGVRRRNRCACSWQWGRQEYAAAADNGGGAAGGEAGLIVGAGDGGCG